MTPDKCRVTTCPYERVRDALYCGSAGNRHLDDLWAGRLRRLADGTFIGQAGPSTRAAVVPEWRRRLTAKDMTRSVA